VRLLAVAVAATIAAVAGVMSRDASHDSGNDHRLANQATEAQVRAHSDVFGIRFLEPTRRGGTYWISDWKAPRRFSGVDPDDPWFDANHGSGTYRAGGGRLVITGETPRMYIHDPALRRQWGDVEVTVYAMRVRDAGIPFAGITAVARANHLRTEDPSTDLCDTRGYGGRLRFDGHADFEKETAHPQNEATRNVEVFPGGLPTGTWIGMKYLVYDRSDGVHLELWLDRTDGRNGGDWKRVDEFVDNGHGWGSVPCAPGIDPQMELTSSPHRVGSESGKPNVSVYFRSDGIGPDGLVYKWASIREISP
jgi:hypothetical protein